MQRSGAQRIIPIVLVIIIIGLAVAALVTLGRNIFGGSSTKKSTTTTQQVNVGKQALTNTETDSSVSMTVRGPLVADENYHSYTITISSAGRNMTTYQGYANKQVANEQLANTDAGYEQFVYALNRAKLMDGTPLTGDANDERGICATGYLYDFTVSQGGNSVQKLWTSSCEGSLGSLKASLDQVEHLFIVQIPDYVKQVQNVKLAD